MTKDEIEVTELPTLNVESILCVLGSSIPCYLRHSNEINEGFSRVQDVTQEVIIDIVP